MKKRKYFDLFRIVVCFFFCQLCLTSCGGDGDGDGEGAVDNFGSIEGSWVVYMTDTNNGQRALTLEFSSDRTGNITSYAASGNTYVRDMSVDFIYKYNRSDGRLEVDDGYETQEWRVMKVTSDKLTINMFNQMLTYTRLDGSDPDENPDDDDPVVTPDEPETNYALDNVADYEFTMYEFREYTKLYFTSNYSINVGYSKSSWSVPVSATYEKLSENAAIINYEYEGTSYGGNKNMQFTLIFTSENAGKVLYKSGIEGTFVCKKNDRDANVSAPYYIGGMKFTAKYGGDTWYRFGEQTSNNVKVTDYSKRGILTYSDIYATYNRTGDKSAELIVYTKLGSYASWEENKYTLEFYTNTTGRFSFYHSNRFNTSSYSGEFTLQ